MGDDRSRILDLLAAGKITAEEAGRLLDALSTTGQAAETDADTSATDAGGGKAGTKAGWPKFFAAGGAKTGDKAGSTGTPKHLFVKIVSVKGDNVNVKVPLALVRAGLKLTSILPPQATEQINKTMAEKGMSFDLGNIKPDDLEELIESMREMEVNIDAANGDTVKVFAA